MIKIAIVDDHQIFMDGLVKILSAQPDFEVLFFENNAKAALGKLKNNTPDIIITDISMPGMNGIEFIKVLKEEFQDVKVLVLSMFNNIMDFRHIDGFLLKETNQEKLIEVIFDIVNNNKKYFVGQVTNDDAFDFKKAILSSREKDIIRLIAKEFTTEEIAEKLFLSKHTVEAHRKNIFFKLQVKNIAGLVSKAIHLGVI